jgi:hypothetical protein
MNNIKFFYNQAIRSLRKGKFYYRPWKNLAQIIFLNFKCLILTGYSLDKLKD